MEPDLLRRWWRDHGEIDRALEEIRIELARDELAISDERLGRVAVALERHFATEEELYFPLAERMHGQSAPLLERARRGHQQLRESVEELCLLVANAEVAPARRAFATLLHTLQKHEEEEVAILVELERLAKATAAPTATGKSTASTHR